VIILKSEGEKAFCAGASFDELMAIEDMQQGKVFFSGFANVINAMRKCKKLIVGRIQGKTVGGGVGLAAACDYALATEAAAIKLI
jgi:methylglutaconyl-CoA hydratase